MNCYILPLLSVLVTCMSQRNNSKVTKEIHTPTTLVSMMTPQWSYME